MNDEEALLAAIRAHPDEDTPRLIYADWLDENGHPDRAEFIRLQHISEFERTAEQGRRHDLLEGWFRSMCAAGAPAGDWRFVRGLPEVLLCGARDYLYFHSELTTKTFIRELFLRGVGDLLAEVARTGWPDSVVVLSLQHSEPGFGQGGARCAQELLRCPHLRGVRELSLRGYTLDEDEARALCASERFERLTRLDVNSCALTLEAVRVFHRRFGSRLYYHLSVVRGSSGAAQDVAPGVNFGPQDV